MANKLPHMLIHSKYLRPFNPISRKKSIRRPEWFQFRRPTEPHIIAHEVFDGLYGKRFGKEWPGMRCAMLCRKKYAAIVNQFIDSDEIQDEFIRNGAVDILLQLRGSANSLKNSAHDDIERLTLETNGPHETQERVEDEVLGQHEQMLEERLDSLKHHYYVFDEISEICPGLSVYCYPRRNLLEFDDSTSKGTTGKIMEYFLLDGSSILPVLALDPKPHDHVLDMCAAPGGKFMSMMQVLRSGTGTIVANDARLTRTNRIRKIQQQYIPEFSSSHDRIKILTKDATNWNEIETAVYDKILADVPCTTDRHSMIPTLEQRDNMFSPLRKRERANLPHLQMDILRNAILACRPGGTVVYSTCTASLQQNEYVVQMVIQSMLQNDGIVCEVEDLAPLTHLLSDHFNFHKDTELGALVIPSLEANYGPTYVCKMVRVNL